MKTSDSNLIEGLIVRMDRLVNALEGKFCSETPGETWLRAAELLKLPQFSHRKGEKWLYRLAKDFPEISKKECLPWQKRGATLWCVERVSSALRAHQPTKR